MFNQTFINIYHQPNLPKTKRSRKVSARQVRPKRRRVPPLSRLLRHLVDGHHGRVLQRLRRSGGGQDTAAAVADHTGRVACGRGRGAGRGGRGGAGEVQEMAEVVPKFLENDGNLGEI